MAMPGGHRLAPQALHSILGDPAEGWSLGLHPGKLIS